MIYVMLRRAARVFVLLLRAVPAATAQTTDAAAPHTVIVRMIDQGPYGMAFDPTRVTVHRGDTVRFVQAGNLPHDVEFKSVPEGTDLGALRSGPNLKTRGETYDIVIDQRFEAGKHVYVCTPHDVLGMAGVIYVVDEPR